MVAYPKLTADEALKSGMEPVIFEWEIVFWVAILLWNLPVAACSKADLQL